MKIAYSIILLLASTILWGQKIENKYLQVKGTEGTLYFIKPQKMDRSSDTPVKALEYDITYLDSKDSAYYTCTIYIPLRTKLTEVCLKEENNNLQTTLELLYAQKKKSYWEYRVRWNIAYSDLKRTFQSNTPYTLSFKDEQQNTYSYSLKSSKWEKQRSIILSIFDVIEINRGE